MSVFEQLCTSSPELQATLKEREGALKTELEDLFGPLQKFIETGDVGILEKEFEKENIPRSLNNTTTKKNKQRKPAVLEEISENSVHYENVKLKREKVSVASSESVCSVASGTFLKESSPKGKETTRRTRQRKPCSENLENPEVMNVKVKKEKLSTFISPSRSDLTVSTDVDIEIKKEDMPAPRKLPPRKKKTKNVVEEPTKRSMRAADRGTTSDVIIQNTTVTCIDITDSDLESEKKSDTQIEEPIQHNMRTTRSKMRQKQPAKEQPQSEIKKVETSEPEIKKVKSTRTKTIKQAKRSRSHSTDEESSVLRKEKKRSKSSTSSENEDKSAHTEYEDAVSMPEHNDLDPQSKTDATFVGSTGSQNIANSTYVADPASQSATLNHTVVVENPKVVKGNENDEINEKEMKRTPPKPKSKKQTKEMFSPYDKTPLKKRVEAFEKLEAEAMQQRSDNKPLDGRPKSKMVTPFTSKFMPKSCSTNKVSKLYRGSKLDTSTSNESTLSVKSVSAIKSTQAEFRVREKRRQEKEREALKKREALLTAQMEEKKRKREEKQLKAQQQRELLEKDKQKQLEEQQRKDEEKYKQAIADKEEKLQKQKEEAEKKRIIAKKKAQIIKMREEKEAKLVAEEAKLAAEKTAKLEAGEGFDAIREANKQKLQKTNQLPVYMLHRPPLLPTDDCYDSDSSEYKGEYNLPAWSKEKELEKRQKIQIAIKEKLKNTFFCRQTHTPDLREIFEVIDPRKLKRTSSAVWKRPPRYTLFCETSNIIFSDDEDDNV